MENPGILDLSVELARRLKAARALSGKKVRELADELGWSAQKLYRLEHGDQVPDALELAAIAAATGQGLDYFDVTSGSGRGTLPPPLPAVNLVDEDSAAA